MKKIESMTPQQEAQMITYREEWRAYGLSTERIDKEKTKECISEMYKLIGKNPPIFIFCPSLMFAQIQIAYCEELFKEIGEANLGANLRANLGDNLGANLGANLRDNLRANLGDNLLDNLWDNLRDNLGANLGANLRDNLGANLRANLGDNLRANLGDNLLANLGDNLGANLRANLWDNLRDNLGDNLRDNLGDNLRANLRANLKKNGFRDGYFYGSMDAFWIAFYEFPEKFLGVKYDTSDSQRLSLMSTLSKSSSWFWAYENYCFISDRPAEINMPNGRLHSLTGPAIKWVDGYEIYYINGREIPKKYFDAINKKEFSIEDFFNEKNEEIKSACIQMMADVNGENYLASFFDSVLKEVDTFINKKDEKYLKGTTGGMNIGVYTLFKGSLNDYEIAYVRCYCPSTDRMFYLGVEPKFKNAKDAIASLYSIPAKLKSHIKTIRRQGERFSTTLTEHGMQLVKQLTKNDFENISTISGDEYFSKMEYEF